MADKKPDEMFEQLGDVFNDLFGAGAGERRGEDLHMPLDLTLAQAIDGCHREITVRRWVLCAACVGTGAMDGSARVRCEECEGRRQVVEVHGELRVARMCAVCGGAGEVPELPCPQCELGRMERDESLTVAVPPGVAAGQQIRLKGKGGELGEGPAGDLYLEVSVTPPRGVTVEGCDLCVTLSLTDEERAAGGSFGVAGSHGEVTVTVPAGVREGEVVMVRGLGLSRPLSEASDGHYRDAGARGSLLVTVRAAKPTSGRVPWRAIAVGGVIAGALAALIARG